MSGSASLHNYSSPSSTENARFCRISRVSSTMSDGAGSKVGLEVMPTITSVTLVTGTVREGARLPARLFVRGGCLFISMIIHAAPGVADMGAVGVAAAGRQHGGPDPAARSAAATRVPSGPAVPSRARIGIPRDQRPQSARTDGPCLPGWRRRQWTAT